MNYTPGPWRYSPAHKDIISMANVGRDDLICDVRGSEHGSVIPSEANARLIAAAPELLDALEHAVEALASDHPDIQLRAAITARAVIAKAKGGA